VVKPRAVIEVPLRCCGTVGVEGTPAEGGEDETAAEDDVLIRGLNISTIEDRRRCCGIGGEGGEFWSDMLRCRRCCNYVLLTLYGSEIVEAEGDSRVRALEAEVWKAFKGGKG
jgi:hypothetical protein